MVAELFLFLTSICWCVGLAFSGKVSLAWAVTSTAPEIWTGSFFFLRFMPVFCFLNFYTGSWLSTPKPCAGRSTVGGAGCGPLNSIVTS